MEKWMAVLDFSGVYRQVRFWEEQENTAYLDLTRQQGTNCYCDDEAAEQIRQAAAMIHEAGSFCINESRGVLRASWAVAGI